MELYIQYGCGLSAPTGWLNFDASPTLRLQKIPIAGKLFRNKVDFPENVLYGDIVKGLPNIKPGSCDGVYCSHVLEHLCLADFRVALKNTYDLLKSGGTFRCVLPDLAASINQYVKSKAENDSSASFDFMKSTLLGLENRPKGIKQILIAALGNSHHLWMWDKDSLTAELKNAGFTTIRECKFNDSQNKKFTEVEDEGRFYSAVAIEAIK
jgi:SAM-dependent methyltransferase